MQQQQQQVGAGAGRCACSPLRSPLLLQQQQPGSMPPQTAEQQGEGCGVCDTAVTVCGDSGVRLFMYMCVCSARCFLLGGTCRQVDVTRSHLSPSLDPCVTLLSSLLFCGPSPGLALF